MDFTQNNRLAQITSQTLIIGVDVAKHKHVARAVDDRGMDLSNRLIFANSLGGFNELMAWAEELAEKHERSNIIVGMEPTGHYWLNLAYYLKAKDIKIVVVNPMKVKRSKELDDDSPTKNDTKDAKVIAQVVRDGRYHEPILPEDVYAELREGMKFYDIVKEKQASIKAQMHNALDRYFPEFLTVFKDWTGKAALQLLEQGYLPTEIVRASDEELLSVVKQAAKRGVGMKQIHALRQAAQNSIGMQTGLKMARQEIHFYIDQHKALKEQLIALEAQLEELVLQVPSAGRMMEIKGVSVLTIAGFFAEVGDLRQYKDPRQIIKLAGLNLKMNQSGLFKGKTSITKRGRKRLRSLLYQVARPLSIHNEGFKALHAYYRNRNTNPLTGKQSFVALSRKLIKILYTMGTRGCAFSEERMLKDISVIHNKQEAA